MELLIGALISLAMQGYKKLGDKFGFEVTKKILYVLLFALAVVYTLLVQNGVLDSESIQIALTVVTASVGTYEMVLKRINPLLEKSTSKK